MKPKFPILKNFKIFGIISILLCATGLVALIALPFGQNFFNLSIDFAGGTEMEFNLHKTVDQTVQTEVRELFQEVTGVDPSSVTSSGDSADPLYLDRFGKARGCHRQDGRNLQPGQRWQRSIQQ